MLTVRREAVNYAAIRWGRAFYTVEGRQQRCLVARTETKSGACMLLPCAGRVVGEGGLTVTQEVHDLKESLILRILLIKRVVSVGDCVGNVYSPPLGVLGLP